MQPAHRTLPLFFFNDTATTEIYTLSLHDALPISVFPDDGRPARSTISPATQPAVSLSRSENPVGAPSMTPWPDPTRSEEHTSELQSLAYLVCRLLLEKKKKTIIPTWKKTRARNAR